MNNWDQFHQSTPKLLPPTVFEKTSNNIENNNSKNINGSSNNPSFLVTVGENESYARGESQFVLLSNEFEKLKNEIKKLHTENETLRHKNKDFVEQAQLYTEATGHRHISISALEEIIHKQTKEIQALKIELLGEKESNTLRLKENEAKYSQHLNEMMTKLNEYEKERRHYEEKIEKTIEKSKQEREHIENEHYEKLNFLNDEKKSLIKQYDSDIEELHKKIDLLRSEKEKENEEKNSRIKNLSEENQKYLNELQNLKNYVNDSMPTIETVKEMKKEMLKYEEDLLKIKTRNENLTKENSALQTRLKSLNEIMLIQENQLEPKQNNSAITSASTSSMLVNEKKRQGLLTKWRTKVFELLVQIKSLEINYKQEKSDGEKTIQEFLERLEEAGNKNKIYENIIEDKKAELCVLSNDNTILSEQLSHLKETNENLEKKGQKDLQSSMELRNFVESLLKQYQNIEQSFRAANRKLTHLDQRVEFAKNRLGVIKTLYSRKEIYSKEELKRANVLDMTTYLSSIHGSIEPNHSNFNHEIDLDPKQNNKNTFEKVDHEDLLREELAKVHKERDLLSNKLQNDMNLMEENISKIKDDYEIKLTDLNAKLNELNELNQFRESKLEQLNEQLKLKETLNDELTKRYENLKEEFLELQNKLDSQYEIKLKNRELEFAEKISALDEKLNEARREQAKAVVLMRQMERSTNREKDRMENLLNSCDSYYKDYLGKLQVKLVSLEKERNILMNTLRQQNNVTSFKNKLNPEENQQLKNLLVQANSTASSSSQKSPIDFMKSSLIENNLMEKNEVGTKKKINQDKNDTTSFWLDSKQNIEEPSSQSFIEEEQEDELDYNNESNDKEQYDLNNSDLNKDNEILDQIRKIMGNLELSDAEESVGNENENQNNESTENDQDQYHYETEHAVDDAVNIFKSRNDSF